MPVAAAGIATLFSGAAFGGGLAGAVAAFAARSALSIGISKLMGAYDTPDASGGGIKTSITVAGEQHPQTAVFGRYATAGAAVCPPYVWDYDDGGEYLTYVISVSDIPVEGLESLIIDGKPCSISEAGQHSQYGKRILDPNGRYDGHAWVRFHDGSQTQADDFLVNAFSDHSSRQWDETMILRGVAYAVLTFRYDQERFTGLPECKFVVKGARLYDPRTDSLVYTVNPIVMSFNVIRGIVLPGSSGTWGINAPASALPLARWIAAMNACDVLVNGLPRYRAGTEFSFSDEPLSVLEELLKTCGGEIADVGGVYNVSVGSPGIAVASITDDDIIISDDREFIVHEGLAKVFNGVNATYPDPAQLWEQREAVPFKNPAWVAQDDGREIPASLTFSAVPYAEQVRRLMRELATDNRRQRRHIITVGPWALVLMPLQTIAWTSPGNGYANKVFEITSIIVNPDTLNCTLALRERDPADYSFDIISDTTLPSAPSPIADDQVIYGLTGFIAEGTAIVGADGQPRRPAIRLSWSSGVPYASISYRIRLKETLDVALSDSIIDVGGGTSVLSAGILPDTEYECQARGVVRGRRSDWSAWQSIRTPGVFVSDADFENGVRSLFENAGMRAIEYLATLPIPGGVVGRTVFLTTDSKLYRWTGTAWVSIVDDALQGALDETNFAQGIKIPKVVATLPATGENGDLVVLSADGKLYRRVNGAWTAAVNSADISGQLTSAQIESVVASKVSGQLTSAQIESVVASKISGQLQAAQIAAIEAGKITGQVSSEQIANVVASKISGQLGAAQIAALEASKLTGQITSVQITDNAISAPKIAAGAITAAKIAANTITADEIAAGTITADEIASNAITAVKISAGAIGADKIAANAVNADKIAANTIVASKLALIDLSNMVPEGDFSEGGANWITQGGGVSIVSDIAHTTVARFMMRLNPSGVGTGYSGVVSEPVPVVPGKVYHLGANLYSNGAHLSIFRINWQDANGGSLGTNNVATNENFTWGYHGANLTAPAGAVSAQVALYLRNDAGASAYIQFANVILRQAASAELIVDGAITADKVAANAITAVKISAGTITGDRLAVNAITAREIAAGTITAVKISAGTITGDRLAVNAITAREIAAGTITATQIAADTITGAKIAAGAIGADQIAAGSILSSKIAVADFTNLVPDDQLLDRAAWTYTAPAAIEFRPSSELGSKPNSLGYIRFNGAVAGSSLARAHGREFPVDAGAEYFCSATGWRQTGDGQITFTIQFRDADGVFLGGGTTFFNRSFSGGTQSGAQIQSQSVVAPAGALTARIYITMSAATNGSWVAASPIVRRKNGGELIVDGAITGDKIVANTITGGLLAASGIITSAAQINNAVITSAKIADAAITSAKIQDLTVGSIKLVNGSVTRQWTVDGGRNLTLSFTLDYPSRVIIGYTYQPTESNLFNGRTWKYGHTLRVNGGVQDFTGGLFITNSDTNEDSGRQLKLGSAFAMNLPAGDHIIAVQNVYGATNATIYVFAGQK